MLGYAFVRPESEQNCSLLTRFYIRVRAGVRRIRLYPIGTHSYGLDTINRGPDKNLLAQRS